MKSIAPSKSRTGFAKILHSGQQAGTLASADLFPEQTRALPINAHLCRDAGFVCVLGDVWLWVWTYTQTHFF